MEQKAKEQKTEEAEYKEEYQTKLVNSQKRFEDDTNKIQAAFASFAIATGAEKNNVITKTEEQK